MPTIAVVGEVVADAVLPRTESSTVQHISRFIPAAARPIRR